MHQIETYQIKDIEKITGIKAHTIRIWESRYQIVIPKRTDTNIRFYDESDLRKLLMVSLLNRAGLKISEIAKYNDEELKEKVNFLYKKNSDNQSHIEALMIALNDLDELKFEKVFNQLLLHTGFENTIVNVIEPFLEKIEILWSTGAVNTAQKNFVFQLVNQKITNASNNETIYEQNTKKRFAVFMPLGIYENLNINFYSYLLKKRNFSVIFLGGNLPLRHLDKINLIKPFSNILTVLPLNYQSDENNEYIDYLCTNFYEHKIFIIDNKSIISELEKYNNLLILNKPEDFKNYLKLL